MKRCYIELLCSFLNNKGRRELATFCRVFREGRHKYLEKIPRMKIRKKSFYEGISLNADFYFYVYESL